MTQKRGGCGVRRGWGQLGTLAGYSYHPTTILYVGRERLEWRWGFDKLEPGAQ